MRCRPHIVAIEQPVQLLRRQRDHILLQKTRPVKLLIALDLLPPYGETVAIPAQNLQRVIATPDEHVQRLRRERILLHPLAHQRSQSVPAGPHVDRRPVQVHLHIAARPHHAASPDINADIQDAAGKLAHSIVHPDGWRIRHTVVVVAAATVAGATRTATNPAGLAFSARRRSPITPLRINTRLTQLHSWSFSSFSRQYRANLTPSFFASST